MVELLGVVETAACDADSEAFTRALAISSHANYSYLVPLALATSHLCHHTQSRSGPYPIYTTPLPTPPPPPYTGQRSPRPVSAEPVGLIS